MDHFAGLDVSVKDTSVCIVDETGRIVREVKVASEPDALLAVLTNPAYHFKRIGLEAGPLSRWLFSVLAEAGLPVIGFMSSRSPEDSVNVLTAFQRGLGEGGLIEGENVAIEFRWARGAYQERRERCKAIATGVRLPAQLA